MTCKNSKTGYLLEGFEPRNVLRHFEDICSIPHGTGHEAALRSHILSLAEKNSLSWDLDAAGNLLVRVPATDGCENAAPFLIQGHMDMVLAKEPWVDRDLVKEPVELVLESPTAGITDAADTAGTDTSAGPAGSDSAAGSSGSSLRKEKPADVSAGPAGVDSAAGSFCASGFILRAKGTTLGADNAVGLCHMMALMDLNDRPTGLRHPPLELLFTVEEEDGLSGIRKADLSGIRSRRMLNMDCGDPDCVVIGAAGGAKYDLSAAFPVTDYDAVPAAENISVLCIEINGLRGGHSGIEAGKNRASALELAGRLLSSLCDSMPVRLCSLDSPPAAYGFPHWMKLTVCVSSTDIERTGQILSNADKAFQQELAETEPGFRMEYTTIGYSGTNTGGSFPTFEPAADGSGSSSATSPGAVTGDTCVSSSACDPSSALCAASAAHTRALADFLILVPFDAQRRADGHPDRVLCSALLSGVSFRNGVFRGTFSIRANRDEYRGAVVRQLHTLCRLTGIRAILRAEPTPAWTEQEDSPLLNLLQSVFRENYDRDMWVQVENGLVEVSVIKAAIPDMDAIGFAPGSRGAHTTDEHLYLDSMPVFWTLFTALLSRLCDL